MLLASDRQPLHRGLRRDTSPYTGEALKGSASQFHQLLLQLALDLAQYPILRKRKTGTPFILHPRRK